MAEANPDPLRHDPEYDITPQSAVPVASGCPVMHQAKAGYYTLFRHADVSSALRDHDLWTSVNGPGPLFAEPELLFFLIGVDPPQHTEERRLVSKSFTPSAVAWTGARTEELVTELLDGLVAKGEGDFIEDVARIIPLYGFAWLIGAPTTDIPLLREWAINVAEGVWPDMEPETMERVMAGFSGTMEYALRLVAERKAALDCGDPVPDDLTTTLVKAGVPDNQIAFAYVPLISASTHTTTWMMGNLIYRLLTNPDQMALLRANPNLAEAAIEESLRYDPPVRGFFRTNTKPTTVHGLEMDVNTKLWPSLMAANHDPEEWDDPERFDITRPLNKLRKHYSFGHGVHYCLGAPIARIEAQIVLRHVLERLPNLRLAGEPTVQRYCRAGMGFDHLPVAWDPPADLHLDDAPSFATARP
jgi:cytochrome P450